MKRFVEQIVTGEFLNVRRDVDLAPKRQKEEQIVDRLDLERDLLRQQILWIGRVNALFSGSLGTLAGMSVLHLLVLASVTEKAAFIGFYSTLALNVNLLFLVFANIAVTLGLTMALVYRHKSTEKMKGLDDERHSYRAQYTVTAAISLVCAVCWAIVF